MKKLIIIFIKLLIISQGYSQTVQWYKNIYYTFENIPTGLAIDQYGNSFLSMYYDNYMNSDIPGTSLLKHDSLGNLLWRMQLDYPQSSTRIEAVCSDGYGNSYITGAYGVEFSIGSCNLPEPIQYGRSFIAKINPTGGCEWVYTDENSGGKDLEVDDDGNVYMLGAGQGFSIYGEDTLIGKGDFIVKFQADGQVLWARKINTTNSDQPPILKVDKNHNIYVSGRFNQESMFGTGAVTKTLYGNEALYVAKFDSTAGLLWVNSASYGVIKGLAIDNENTYISGKYSGNITFGSYFLQSDSARYPYGEFTVKIDENGEYKWISGKGGHALAFDENSNILYGFVFNEIGLDFGTIGTLDGSFTLLKNIYDPEKPTLRLNAYEMRTDEKGNCFITGNILDQSRPLYLLKIKDLSYPLKVKPVMDSGNLFSIFPNPTGNSFTINWPLKSSMNVLLTLRDVTGKIVFSKKYYGQTVLNESLSLDYIAKGIYLVEGFTNNEKITQKIVFE